MKRFRTLPLLFLLAIALAWFLIRPGKQTAFERNVNALHYSKHAMCRMNCRQISKPDVEQILRSGKINLQKSHLNKALACDNTYALESKGTKGQRLRIVYAPCEGKITVVTVIDLDQDWPCMECEKNDK